MSVSDEFSTYILELLEPLGSIQTTRMFGGVLLKVNGKHLGILIEETVYFKVTDRVLQKRYTEEGSKQFTYTRKDKQDPVVIQNWWSVPESALDAPDEMVRLAEEVLEQ